MKALIRAIKTEWELVMRGKTRRELIGDVLGAVALTIGTYLLFLLS